MVKTKVYSDVDSFSKEALGLDDYDSWLISVKNKLIASIVKTRKEKSLTQQELAELLGTTQSVISRIEQGTSRGITLDYLLKIMRVLGVLPTIKLKKVA